MEEKENRRTYTMISKLMPQLQFSSYYIVCLSLFLFFFNFLKHKTENHPEHCNNLHIYRWMDKNETKNTRAGT